MAEGRRYIDIDKIWEQLANEKEGAFPHGIKSLSDIVAADTPAPSSVVERLVEEGGVSLLVARQKEGMSMLALQLAIDVANGIPFLGHLSTQKGQVLFIDYENREATVKERATLLAQGHDLTDVLVKTYERINQRDFGLQGEELNDLIALVEDRQPSLVVFNPLTLAAGGGLRNAKDVAQMLESLAALHCVSPRTGILMLHDATRAKAIGTLDWRKSLLRNDPRSWIDKALGSHALIAGIETIIGFEQHDDGKFTLATVPRSCAPIVWELEKEIGGERFVLAATDDQLRTFTQDQRNHWASLPNEFTWSEGAKIVGNSTLGRIVRKATPLLLAQDPQTKRYRKLRTAEPPLHPEMVKWDSPDALAGRMG